MSTDTLLDAATELAYIVQHEPSVAVADAIRTGIRPEDKNALIVLLAALIDIDRPRSELAATLKSSPSTSKAIDLLTEARVASYRPQYEAAEEYRDRDPEVRRHGKQYADAMGLPWTG